jgi:hypothetical protein
MATRHPHVGPAARTLRRTTTNLRPSIWPGLALAGGVVIAAVVVLLAISGGGGPREGRLPGGPTAGDTRLFPRERTVAGTAEPKPPARRRRARGISAAEFEYDPGANRGLVLGGP